MRTVKNDIQIIAAPSILGLKPTGVERLAENMLDSGLAESVGSRLPVINIPTLNEFYDPDRDPETNCLNLKFIRDFSVTLCKVLVENVDKNCFSLVLGGDCSILLGIMPGLKSQGTYGLIFLDAHADFYEPEKSISGEVADMDLAIVTGRGPEVLTNINYRRPYVKDEHVIHIGQRDLEETQKYGSQNIRDTSIQCIDLKQIETVGIEKATEYVLAALDRMNVDGFWMHLDTDVLSDDINPAVDYRLPGGLLLEQLEYLLRKILITGKIRGMSISIFNPTLDGSGVISKTIVQSLGKVFRER